MPTSTLSSYSFKGRLVYSCILMLVVITICLAYLIELLGL